MTDRISHDDLSDCMPDVDVIMREARHGRGEQKMVEALSRDTLPPMNDAIEGEQIAPIDPRELKFATTRRAPTRDASGGAKDRQSKPFRIQVALCIGAVTTLCILMLVLLVWKQEGPKGARDTTPSGVTSARGSPSANAIASSAEPSIKPPQHHEPNGIVKDLYRDTAPCSTGRNLGSNEP